jgi:hypothetical protein
MQPDELRDFFTYRSPRGHIIELRAEERQVIRRAIVAIDRASGQRLELLRLGFHDGSEEEALFDCGLQVAISYPGLTPIRELPSGGKRWRRKREDSALR